MFFPKAHIFSFSFDRRIAIYFLHLIPDIRKKRLELDENYQLRTRTFEEDSLRLLDEVMFYSFENGVFNITPDGWIFIPEEKCSNPEFMKDYVKKTGSV